MRGTPGMRMCAIAVGVALAGPILLQAKLQVSAQPVPALAPQSSPAAPVVTSDRELLDRYCLRCHNARMRTAGLVLDNVNPEQPAADAQTWEKVVRKLRTGLMPPPGNPRPDKTVSDAFVTRLETALDEAAGASPNPGPFPARRLNRTEYVNAVRDLFSIEIDGAALLPADAADEGFDNMAGGLTVSPVLMERYVSVARRIARLAVGDPTIGPGFGSKLYALSKTLYQDDRMSDDLPFGSRGGIAIRHHFPLDGEYIVRIRLRRQLYDYIRGLREPHQIEVRLDRARVKVFAIGGGDRGRPAPVSFAGDIDVVGGTSPDWEKYQFFADSGLEVRFPARAGSRVVGVSFVRRPWEPEGVAQPPPHGFALSVDESRSSPWGSLEPAIESISVLGSYNAVGPGDTASRRRIFTCRPARASEEDACAKTILSAIARRAYRRPATQADVNALLPFYRAGRGEGGFEGGIQEALVRILVDPEFLLRIERTPARTVSGAVRRLTDLELASRLSFFLWSSIPDDELLDLAVDRKLQQPGVLDRQVRRMLADTRSSALVENFAIQWLGLRSLEGAAPNPELFPGFDDNLRAAFRRETELFIESQLRDDRGILELLTADYSFLNQRLARHYGIRGVYGSRFRRVRFANGQRGGLLGQGSILTVTSYTNRTSPVLRGKWLLDNIFGTPPPPPPPDIPALDEAAATVQRLSVREQMVRHRSSAVCASCHVRMDPLGFALENFDAVGQWRATQGGAPVDASGVFPDGTRFEGIVGLRALALSHGDEFIGTFTDKLLMYALGRGLTHHDMPAVRQIIHDAARDDYRWSSIVLGIVRSVPFQMRRSESS